MSSVIHGKINLTYRVIDEMLSHVCILLTYENVWISPYQLDRELHKIRGKLNMFLASYLVIVSLVTLNFLCGHFQKRIEIYDGHRLVYATFRYILFLSVRNTDAVSG